MYGGSISFGLADRELSGNPAFDVPEGVVFFNIGQKTGVVVGGIELKKGECAVLKGGKLVKLEIKITLP